MKRLLRGAAIFAVTSFTIASTEAADAASYIFQFSGEIDAQRAVNSQFQEIRLPDSSIKTGDKVRGSITFDAKRSTFDHAGSGFEFYFTDGRDFSLEIGKDFKWTSLPGQSVFNRIV